MKQRFQILNDPRFHLVYGVTQRFSYGPSPKLVRLNREGFTLVSGLKRKTPVYPGMLLGEHPAPDKGDLFASIHGEISEITERSVFLAATALPRTPQKWSLWTCSGRGWKAMSWPSL